jgi:hypothetical protein
VESQTSHCEQIAAKDLECLGDVRVDDGSEQIRFRFYADRSVDQEVARGLFYTQHAQTGATVHPIALQCFARALHGLCSVFNLNPAAVHIYFSPLDRNNTIAFNVNRVLFFNYAYFLDMQAAAVLRRIDARRQGDLVRITLAQIGADVFTYWYMTFCHELSHNFVAAHDQQFAFYIASFARQHLPMFFAFLQQHGIR